MNLCEKIVKREIRELSRIRDTFDERFDYLRLDKKERLIPFDGELFKKFRDSLIFEDLSGYYELGPTYRKLAGYLGIRREQLLLASGSDLAIKSVFEACLEKNDKIILHVPGYAMFRVYAKMFGVKAEVVPVKKDWNLDVDEMLGRVDGRTKMVVIENPNGFVGTKPEAGAIEFCAKELNKKDVLLLVDEAYAYLETEKSETPNLIAQYPNVLITQTFSKAHGLAGLRVGYLIGDKELMTYISRVRPMHEISSFSAKAAEWVLDHPSLLNDYQVRIKESKSYLIKELEKLHIEVRDTHASFVLAHFPAEGRTRDMVRRLKDKKVLIRRPFEEEILQRWSLVCVGRIEDSKRFVEVLAQVLNEAGQSGG